MQSASQAVMTVPINPDADMRMKEFAHQLAQKHTALIARPRRNYLLAYLQSWEKTLYKANSIFKAVPTNDLPGSRAGEWMLDNYYILKQTFRQIKEDLPTSYLNQLPRLEETELKGHTRIFAVAWEWIGYSQSQIDLNQAANFLQTYQQVTPLKIGELWAMPIMLRIGFLGRLVSAVAELTGLEQPKSLALFPSEFTTQVLSNETIVANSFLSLRLLSATDWKIFFEQTSRVEQILRTDPAHVYANMDFDTRNNYRNVIEVLARHSKLNEEEVALKAVELAANEKGNSSSRNSHVGYYLLDAGRAILEKAIHFQPEFRLLIRRLLLDSPTSTYLGSIAILSLLFVLGLLTYAFYSGASTFHLIFVGLFGFGLAIEAAITVVHWNVTHRIKPQSLPRLDFSEGIPSGNRTMVVVPTLIETEKEIAHLLQELELYYLSNPDPQLTFALLTDFGDAPTQNVPGDDQLITLGTTGIQSLNKKYFPAAPFYLFHRQREWNPSEGVWMGWERKRGKLSEFNRLLLNIGETTYTTQVGDASILGEIKYVITLDSDTSLPQGSANRLIATLAHPLNQAEFAPDGRSVVAGYTVLQPRVAIKPTSANRSQFSQIYSGNVGFDLYSFAISDVYQDLFGEGSYVGKGIYDVAAFERSLAGQVRENTLLSHDLFEGIYGRAALVTDVVLYEEYPSRYLVYARRMRRWIRGDWQLLPWLFPYVHTENGIAPNRLSTINIWKVFDNLRRSLLPPTLLAMFAASWLFLPGSPLIWTLLVLVPSALPIAAQTINYGRHNIGKLSLKQLFRPTIQPLIRWALALIFLPFEALLILSAIGTTLIRLFIARKKMLQWTTAANAARIYKSKPQFETWREMALSLVLTVILAVTVALVKPGAFWIAFPLLASALLAPYIAYVISQPIKRVVTPLSEAQTRQVRRLARRTWAFFEQFAGPDDHWLPPDHFQESPRGSVAHYTTPTNIGLFMLSTLAAYDMGYTGLLELQFRLQSTFESIAKLEHYRGHLLNWYDSQTYIPLPPRYISTVDSGNLAACLITLKQGCLAIKDRQVLGKKRWQGLMVLLDILSEVLQSLEKDDPHSSIDFFKAELSNIYQRVDAIQGIPATWTKMLAWLSGNGWEKVSLGLMELLQNHPNLNAEALAELQLYLELFHNQLLDMQHSLDLFAPWLCLLETPPEVAKDSPAWRDFFASLPTDLPTLGQAATVYERIKTALHIFEDRQQTEATRAWCQKLDEELTSAINAVNPMVTAFQNLASQANDAVAAMDFHFLFNERRHVFHIGYNASSEQLDQSFYDLLASEARIASLVAIARGDIPQSHWQHLGRPVTKVNSKQVLLSWSGTMFEYLMPSLFAKNYDGTFLSDSCFAAVDAQIDYGSEMQVPWGISESGYYAFDMNLNYQYRAFGVPDLGYKRDLPDDLVIAPYASLMGLSLQPLAVLKNMAHLEQLNMLGRFGFYESMDFTKTRLPEGQTHAIVKSYMAHHQGMIMIASCNYLLNDVMVQRFHSDERIQSVELLLQEKIPVNPPIEYPHPDEPVEIAKEGFRSINSGPWRVPVDSPIPLVHLLSRGDSSLLISNAGGGYSQWRETALTRWQADTALDQWGTWIYIQDLESGDLWSATCQPIGCSPEYQEVQFFPHKVEFQRWDNGISLRTEIAIGMQGVEIRRVNILNDSDRPRRLKLTSYAEVVLAEQGTDRRHPAFSKLFIESEYLPRDNALLFHRRPRSSDEKRVTLAHALVVESTRKVTGDHETDRAQFLGRNNTPRHPGALQHPSQHLSGTTGGTLDPIMSLAQEIDLKPHSRTRVTFLTAAAESRNEVLEKIRFYHSPQLIFSAFDEARSERERELIELGLNTNSLENIQRVLSALLYPVGSLRAAPHILAQNEKGQSSLWAFGISGDYPILLLRIHDGESPLLQEALQAFIYWHRHHVNINLVILNEQDTGYALDLHNAIFRQIRRMGADALLNQRDGIFVLRSDQLQHGEKILFETVAGVILDENGGSLAEHAVWLTTQRNLLPKFTPLITTQIDPERTIPLEITENLLLDNGLGGFSQDGKEYVIHLQPGQHTPQPWINVIANPQFGFLVSESGLGSTWSINSGENRLTPWRNDPVTDKPAEAIYIRDEETGVVWSPTPMPAGADTPYVIRHGAGYSIFENQSHGIKQKLRLFADPNAPVKIAHLRLQNLWKSPRRITVTYYAEWVLGTTRDMYQAHIMPEFVPEKHALLATNHYNSDFGDRVAFLAANKKPHGLTTDRTEFLGRLGSMRNPAALGRIGLNSAVNAGLDPCAAIQLHVDLPPGGVEEIYFTLGECDNRSESLELIGQVKTRVEDIWQSVHEHWDAILDAVKVNTPDLAMDIMLNRWLLYQTVSCRLWGRTALYQSSGAYGFRDQLQDVMALLHSRPAIVREQILEAARHQFEAGDVLHWWNPPVGRGVRTRFSDDLLWLPFVTSEYVAATGDISILHEEIPFLVGEPLKPEEMERYSQFNSTENSYSLYEHCRRAVEKGTTSGAHGIPLIGGGDWNDGMNRIGKDGRGESIWLAWFLNSTLKRFALLSIQMKEDPTVYLQQADQVARNIEANAWDGNWYLRAYYDDGSRLGSNENNECQIDSIAQSWAVLSGAADPERAALAMQSVDRLLVKESEQMILLFTPPFDRTVRDPGYIKGYLPGVRENGGQYTHAATWTAWAFATLGQGDKAGELFQLLNPINHTDTPEKVEQYKVEPYVIAADVYSAAPHTGRGGWTWYTGSSGWMYRLGLEAILGISRVGNAININPCIPHEWDQFTVEYRFGNANFIITVKNPQKVSGGVSQVKVDGKLLPEPVIPLTDDGQPHEVLVLMG